jgi:uncharacterized tellurite resistance protein B-like protein
MNMGVRKSQLYSAFGEMIYTMAMADGKVHTQEVVALQNLLQSHEWARGISWSFDYENQRKRDIEEVMTFAMRVFKQNGPSDEYPFFLDVLEKVAEAHGGIVKEEKDLIDLLKKELLFV